MTSLLRSQRRALGRALDGVVLDGQFALLSALTTSWPTAAVKFSMVRYSMVDRRTAAGVAVEIERRLGTARPGPGWPLARPRKHPRRPAGIWSNSPERVWLPGANQ